MKHAVLNNGPDSRETQKKDLGSGEAIGPSSGTYESLDPSTSNNMPQRTVDQPEKPGAVQVLYSADEVAKIIGCSVRSVWRMVADGELPRPVSVRRSSKWFMSNIEAYLQKLRDQQNGKIRRR